MSSEFENSKVVYNDPKKAIYVYNELKTFVSIDSFEMLYYLHLSIWLNKKRSTTQVPSYMKSKNNETWPIIKMKFPDNYHHAYYKMYFILKRSQIDWNNIRTYLGGCLSKEQHEKRVLDDIYPNLKATFAGIIDDHYKIDLANISGEYDVGFFDMSSDSESEESVGAKIGSSFHVLNYLQRILERGNLSVNFGIFKLRPNNSLENYVSFLNFIGRYKIQTVLLDPFQTISTEIYIVVDFLSNDKKDNLQIFTRPITTLFNSLNSVLIYEKIEWNKNIVELGIKPIINISPGLVNINFTI